MDQESILRSIGGYARRVDPLDDLVKRFLVRKLDRKVTQANCIGGRRRCALSLPGVQAQMVMVVTGRNERHAEGFGYAHDIETNDAVIEVHGLLDVTDMQVNMTHAC